MHLIDPLSVRTHELQGHNNFQDYVDQPEYFLLGVSAFNLHISKSLLSRFTGQEGTPSAFTPFAVSPCELLVRHAGLICHSLSHSGLHNGHEFMFVHIQDFMGHFAFTFTSRFCSTNPHGSLIGSLITDVILQNWLNLGSRPRCCLFFPSHRTRAECSSLFVVATF